MLTDTEEVHRRLQKLWKYHCYSTTLNHLLNLTNRLPTEDQVKTGVDHFGGSIENVGVLNRIYHVVQGYYNTWYCC